MTATHPVIERYVAQLDAQLSGVAAADRQEILHDIRSHLSEAAAAGRPVDAAIEALGPAEALARAYTVELMLNPRRAMSARTAYRLKVAGVIAAASLPTLFFLILFGGVGAAFLLAGVVSVLAGIVDAVGELPPWVQTNGMQPLTTIALGGGMIVVGMGGILALRRFVRFVAASWRTTLPKLIA